jgi:hypothetical protein
MGHIYKSAVEVILWLGWRDGSSHLSDYMNVNKRCWAAVEDLSWPLAASHNIPMCSSSRSFSSCRNVGGSRNYSGRESDPRGW